MLKKEHSSVYALKLNNSDTINSVNSLQYLKGDENKGWHVARNLLKPLNHLDFLKRQENIAAKLNLHNTITSPELFDLNYHVLEEHQQGKVTTSIVLNRLSSQLKDLGNQISPDEIRTLLQEYATVCHMEFHPSDICNLTCLGCTYGHDDLSTKPLPINYPFKYIPNIAKLKPKSMVIIGGGEPTLYRNDEFHFQELVDKIMEDNDKIKLALTTNGTVKPPGDWPNKFSWIRISLDAATEGTYKKFRGKSSFNKVVENFISYLDYDTPYVGISFLFAKSNIHEYAAVSNFIYNLVKKEKPDCLHKVNIQYRPMRQDPYNYHKPFIEAITDQQIRTAVKDIIELADSSSEMKIFLRDQTNITAVLGGNTHPPYEFTRCFYSQTFKIVRANGDLRPCFIRVKEPNFILGNIIRDPLETIALNTLYVGSRRKHHCNSLGCRQCHVNYVFEQGLAGKFQPPRSQEVQADTMY
jgi:sulfatase maturation enzyme AslB (radical SAM superfamily)